MKIMRLFPLVILLLVVLLGVRAAEVGNSVVEASPGTLVIDDFNDGDFTSNPSWTDMSSQGCAPSVGSIGVDVGELHIQQSGAGGCGNAAQIQIDLDVPLEGREAVVSFDVMPIYSTVVGGTGQDNSEWPARVWLEVEVEGGGQKTLLIGYNYRGGFSQQKVWGYVVGFGNVPQGEWQRNQTFTLQDYIPDATRLLYILVGGAGWDYESRLDNISLTLHSQVIAVDIDIKPGSDPNSINLACHGRIPVAILTTADFDAATVDPETVLFEGAVAKHWALEDVDADGDDDLILHFKCQEVSIEPDATEACLEGSTYDGVDIQGCDSVRIVPPHSPADSDGDAFADAIEICLGTDPLRACPHDPTHDAWPLDISMDTFVTVVGDVRAYAGNVGEAVAELSELQRLDLNTDGYVTVVGDVRMYAGRIGETCTQP